MLRRLLPMARPLLFLERLTGPGRRRLRRWRRSARKRRCLVPSSLHFGYRRDSDEEMTNDGDKTKVILMMNRNGVRN